MAIRLFKEIKHPLLLFYFVFVFSGSVYVTHKRHWSHSKTKKESYYVCNWIQQFGSSHIFNKYRRIAGFINDETMIQIANYRFSASNSIKSASINSLSLGLSFSGTLTLMWTSSSPRPWLWFIPSPLSRSTVPL